MSILFPFLKQLSTSLFYSTIELNSVYTHSIILHISINPEQFFVEQEPISIAHLSNSNSNKFMFFTQKSRTVLIKICYHFESLDRALAKAVDKQTYMIHVYVY